MENKHNDFTQEVLLSQNHNTISIINNNDFPVKFKLKINDEFPLSMKDVTNKIHSLSQKNHTSNALEAFMYVHSNTFWSIPHTLENWQHNPLLFLNSIGGGMCDDRASVLSSIWGNWYDSVRVIVLGGHVVSEVKIDGKWQMFDADNGVAYQNSIGEIVSVKSLEDSSLKISQPTYKSVIGNNLFLKYKTPFANKLATYYQTTDDNFNATDWHLDYTAFSDIFSLPSKSKIQITHSDGKYFLKVILSEKSKGSLCLPFVPYSASGKIEFMAHKKYSFIDDDIFLFDNKVFLHEIDIQKVHTKSKINYLINSKLNWWKSINEVKVEAKDSLKIISESTFKNDQLIFGENWHLFDVNLYEYQSVIHDMILLKPEEISWNNLRELYLNFLEVNSNLTHNQKEMQLNSLKLFFKTIQKNRNYSVLFNENYPKSLLFVFISVRDGKIDLLEEMINSD